jgi:hypothetical protein
LNDAAVWLFPAVCPVAVTGAGLGGRSSWQFTVYSMEDHKNLFLSIGSAIGSLFSGLIASVTAYNIMWGLSLVAAVVSIVAGYYTIKEKRMNIKRMKRYNNF